MRPDLLLAPNTPAGGGAGRLAGTACVDLAALNTRYRHDAASSVLDHALSGALGRVALVSSFGTEAVVLLHMLAVRAPAAPVLFLETGFHFAETLTYQMELTERLGLRDVRLLRPSAAPHPDDGPGACCHARKVAPLRAALAGFDVWITGRKRLHGAARRSLSHFEPDGPRTKVNPLAYWQHSDMADYIAENRLPRHPLVARGFASVGCAPCTRPSATRNQGRWAGTSRTECGIHLPRIQGTDT